MARLTRSFLKGQEPRGCGRVARVLCLMAPHISANPKPTWLSGARPPRFKPGFHIVVSVVSVVSVVRKKFIGQRVLYTHCVPRVLCA